jgi:tRNA(adenine34) deaminase
VGVGARGIRASSLVSDAEGAGALTVDELWMQRALALAHWARGEGEVPVGAIVVRDGVVLGQGWNRPIASSDPTAHAEVLALRRAARSVGNYRLPGTTLYVTLEPCAMCAGAIVHARVSRVVFGAYDPKGGAARSAFALLDSPALNHRTDWRGGVLQERCAEVLTGFFTDRRRSS